MDINALLSFFGLNTSEIQQPEKVKYRMEVGRKPTSSELETIIQHWKNNGNTQWNDIGFELSGESEILWLSGSYRKMKISLDLDRKNNAIFDEFNMLQSLIAERTRCLNYATQ